MYLAVDVGGTKTLVAEFSKDGLINHSQKIPTSEKYEQFIETLRSCLEGDGFDTKKIEAACIALPGKIDRQNGVGLIMGNLKWQNVPIMVDMQKILGDSPVFVDNDANLAGLYEAHTIADKYRNVLYLTVSTGIGDGIITDGKINPNFADSEAGQMILEHEDKLQKWEDFASGRAFAKKYGQKAADVDNPYIWKQYSRALAKGIGELMAVMQPDAIVIGGGLGAHLEKFKEFLEAELIKYESNLVKTPPIIKAKQAEEAVIYGCYEYIKQNV